MARTTVGSRSEPAPEPGAARREPDFVGRDAELAAARGALAGAPGLLLIEGEAGVGKTRLVRTVLAGKADGVTLVAACPPFRQPQTLAPLVDAVRGATEGVRGLGLSPLGGALRPLLPEWAEELPAAPEPAEDATAARHRLFRAFAELMERLGVDLLVVEDAHWADEPTLEFLLFLGSGPACGVRLVVTYRPEDVAEGSLLRRLASRRWLLGSPVRIELGPLSEPETAELMLSMLAGERVTAEFARFLHDRTDGLPLAIEESMRLMVGRNDVIRRRGELMRRPLSEIQVPATIRDAVLERVQQLSDQGRDVLRAVAVLGAAVGWDVVVAVSGLPAGRAPAGRAEAIDCGLLTEDERGQVSFRHVLPGQVIYEATAASVRLAMHQRAGEALKTLSPVPAAQLVRHFRNARDTGQWTRYAEQAAGSMLDVGDRVAAGELLLDLIIHAGLPAATMARLASKLSFAVFPGEDVLKDVAAALRTPLDAGGLSRADEGILQYQIGRILAIGDDEAAARSHFELAVRHLPAESAEAALAMIRLGWPDTSLCPAAENLRWLRRAAAVPPPADPVTRLRLLVDRVSALIQLGEVSGWTEVAGFPEDAEPGPMAFHVVRSALNIAEMAIKWGRHEEAARRIAIALRISEEHSYERLRGAVLATRAHLDWVAGTWEGLSARAADLADDECFSPLTRADATIIRGMLHIAAGATDQARECLRQAVANTTRNGNLEHSIAPTAALAGLSLAEEDVVEALRLTSEPMDLIARKGVWIWATEIVPVRVAALLAAGQHERAAELVSVMTRTMRGTPAHPARAAMRLCRAILDEARGEHDRAATGFGRAASAWQALSRPYDSMLARKRQACCLIDGGNRDAGLELLAQTATELTGLGAIAEADRAVNLLRRNGVQFKRPGFGRPGYGGTLSPRELEVVRLLATGQTDKEIADTLFLSPRTIATHLESARRKLSATSRTGLVFAALNAGLIEPPR